MKHVNDPKTNQDEQINDIAIIGGGPVGIFSVFAFGMQSLKCVLIDALTELGGQCACVYPEKYIYDIPGFPKIKGHELVSNLINQAMIFDPKILLNSKVQSITKHENYFILSINSEENEKKIEIKARAVVIALGAGIFRPVNLDIEGSKELENKQIFYFINEIEKFKDKNVAIIGAGDSAIDWALDLADNASNIYLIHRREYIKAHPATWQKVLGHPKIKIKIPYIIEKLHLKDDILRKLHLIDMENNSQVLDIDYILPCIGLKSDISFLNEWGLDIAQNRIMVDPTTMRTSKSGVYAIGDCVYYNNKRKLILTGFAEAASCAVDIFKYIYPNRALQIGHSTSIGLPK